MNPQNSYISYRNVSKAFGPQVVCKDLNLDINRSEILCIIGPSGIGKTVVIKMLVGLLEADEGEILFDGENVVAYRTDRQFLQVRKRIAMVFQSAALFDSMSVFDNIAYPIREQMKVSGSELDDRVQEKLNWVGLPNVREKMPAELSGGMKKRVGLARSIATDPEVILYDEPTAGLDPINTVRISDLILSLQEKLNCTSVVVTHDIPVFKKLGDRAAFMYGGKMAAIGTPEELFHSEVDFVRGFLAADPKLADLA